LKFYNRKSKASRLSKLDDNLIAETLSVINTHPVVPQCVGSASSPPSVIVAQTSSEGTLVLASQVPPGKGSSSEGVSQAELLCCDSWLFA
jgi:hypothetical protein